MSDADLVDFDRWNTVHRRPATPVLDRIRRHHLTGCLPAEVDATTLWPAWPLDEVARHLALPTGGTLVDAGCGRGEVGRWVARHRAAGTLVGVDPAIEGVTRAAAAARTDGSPAHYLLGHMHRVGLRAGCADAVMVVDALHFLRDWRAPLAELGRLLRPGGRLVVVGPVPAGVGDPEDAARAAGLTPAGHHETPGWRDAVRAFRAALADEAEAVRPEVGPQLDFLLSPQADAALDEMGHGLLVLER